MEKPAFPPWEISCWEYPSKLCSPVCRCFHKESFNGTVFQHMGVLVYNEPTYYYHQRHLLIPTVVSFWRKYQKNILDTLKGKEVVLAGDGRHDSMGHSAKFGTYTMFCCTVGLIIHVVLVQVGVPSFIINVLLWWFLSKMVSRYVIAQLVCNVSHLSFLFAWQFYYQRIAPPPPPP